jgi:hypothetical protein
MLLHLLQGHSLALCHIELDRRLASCKEGVDLLEGGGVIAEDVDVIEVGQDKSVGAKAGGKVIQEGSDTQGEHQRTKRVTLADSLGRG